MNFAKVAEIKGRGITPLTKQKAFKSYPCDDILEDPFGAISIFAPSNSGKSVLISNLIDWITAKHPEKHEVIIFSKTLEFETNNTYGELIKRLRKRGVRVEAFSGLDREIPRPTDFNPRRVLLESNLKPVFDRIKADKIALMRAEEGIDTPKPTHTERGTELCVKVIPKKTEEVKAVFRDKIVVFDDLAKDTRGNELLNEFIRYGRHANTRIILSSQSLVDASKDFRENIKTLIVFRGLEDSRLKTIFEMMHPAPALDEWVEAYRKLLEPRDDSDTEKYAFLVIYPGGKICRNFKEVWKLKNEFK